MRLSKASMFVTLAIASSAGSALADARPDLSACFTASSRKWALPAGLLEAVAKVETDGFHNIPEAGVADEDHPKIYGVMGLRSDPVLGHSLEAAAALSGQPISALIESPCANIEGAAALLADGLRHHANNLAAALLQFWTTDGEPRSPGALDEVARLLRTGAASGRVRFGSQLDVEKTLQTDLTLLPIEYRKKPPHKPSQGDGGVDYPGAEWDGSSNFDSGDITPRYIVMHTTEGGFDGAVDWLKSKKSGVSAHYVIRKSDGYVKQLVRETDKAFHARCWNVEAIGVEMEGFLKDSETFTPALLDAAAKVAADIAQRHGISVDDLHIIGHNFGDTDKIKQTPLKSCNDHADPGLFFPWNDFLGMVNGGGGGSGEQPAPAPSGGGSSGTSNCSWWQFWCH